MLNISGIDKTALLKQLWLQREPALFFSMNPSVKVPEWDDEAAEKALARKCKIDYFQGRAIKTDLSKDEIDPSEYNKYGKASFADAIEKLKNSKH